MNVAGFQGWSLIMNMGYKLGSTASTQQGVGFNASTISSLLLHTK